MDSNICLGCKYSSIRIDITVPEKYNIIDFAKETKEFTNKTIPSSSQKPIHYSLKFDSERTESGVLDFKVDCSCLLKDNKTNCPELSLIQEKNHTLQQGKQASRGKKIEIFKTI